jgi:hypothetical protein
MDMTFLFGCNDGEWEEDVDVTEEEYERLRRSYASGKDFYEDESVRDIYKRVWEIADKSATSSLLAYNEDIAEKYGKDPNFKASDLYQIHVQFYFDDIEMDDDWEDEEEACI